MLSNKKLKTVALIGASILTVVLAGCAKEAERSASVGREFKVDTLFTHGGCTVYRFTDSGHYRYFTNCRGEASWQESCGKGCSRSMNVSGNDR